MSTLARRCLLLVSFFAAACSAAPTVDSPTTDTESKKESTKKNSDPAEPSESPVKPIEELAEEWEPFLDPPVIYSGFTGGAEVFKVPLFTNLEGELEWKLEDPSVAEIVPIEPPSWALEFVKENPDFKPFKHAMLTTKKAGATKVVASAGGQKLEVPLNVVAYTSAAYATGQTRYKTGGTDARRPCAGCHESPTGVDHSSRWLSPFDDQDVLSAIQTGVYSSDGWVLSSVEHKWELTEDEKTGIMAYLRGLPPKGY